jgi:hypothetical protein
VQCLQVDLGAEHAIDVADRREASFEGHATNALGEHRAADRVDDEIGTAAVGRLEHCVGERGRAHLDADVEAELAQARELGGRARGADHARTERLRRLQRCNADARGHAADEQPFAGSQTSLRDEHVVDDEKDERHRRRCFDRERRRHRHRFAHVHQRVFGERARAASHDDGAGRRIGDAGAERDDLARAFEPRRPCRTALHEPARDQLAAVEPRGMHPDEQLARPGIGHRHFAPLEDDAVALGADRVGLHRQPPPRQSRQTARVSIDSPRPTGPIFSAVFALTLT